MIGGVAQTPAPHLVDVHGPALRHVRTSAGLSVRTLAEHAGLSFTHLARLERGENRRVRPDVFAALVQALAIEDPRVLQLDPYAHAA